MATATEEPQVQVGTDEEPVAFDATKPRGETLSSEAPASRADIDAAAAELSKADAVKGEAGEPVGDMPPETPKPAPAADPETIEVAGMQITPASLGGKKPQTGSLSFSGTKIGLMAGTFLKKGQVIKFSGEAVVDDVGQKDIRDKETGQVTEATQKHNALVLDLQIEVGGE